MEIPVSQAGCNDILTVKIGFIHFDHTKLKICIKVGKMANSTILFIKQSTVIQKSWDQHPLKDIVLSYSQNFESQFLNMQGIFGGFYKLTGKHKNRKLIS
jgi:hypothetical protein